MRLLSAHVRRASLLAVAGGVANAANVIVTVVIARLLTPRAYGALAVLVGLFFVLSMPGSALVVAVVRRVTAWEHHGHGAQAGAWAAGVRRRLLVGLVGLAITGAAVRGPLSRVLGLPNPQGVGEVMLAGGGWLLLCVDRGLLQARQAYPALARNLIVEGAARTVLTVGLIAAGLGVDGAALGLVAAMVVSEIDARRSALRLYPNVIAPRLDPATDRPPGLAIDATTALGALGLLAALQSVDIVILGRQAPHHSGAYAAISVTSKALVYAALVLSAYLLPEAALRRHAGERARHQLGIALGIVAIPAAGLLAVSLVAAHTLIRLVFGPDLVSAAPALATLAGAMTCLAATALFTHYLLAMGSRWVVALLAVGLIVAVPALTWARGDPVDTARADLACQAALAACAGLLAWRVPLRTSVPGPLAADALG